MYHNSCEWISKNNNPIFFKYLKAKKQGFHLTPIRIFIMHELLLRKYGTNISRSNFLKVVKGNFGLKLLPHGINMWTSYLVSGWGLILLIFWVIFMWVTMMLQFLASYCHLARLLLQLTFVLNKNNFFQGFHLSTLYTIIIYYYIYYYHNLNNNDNYLNPTTYITNKNQYFLFYLFSENTTRGPWHWITNRAQRQDQPYSNESLEIQPTTISSRIIHANQRSCVVTLATKRRFCASYETLGCQLI